MTESIDLTKLLREARAACVARASAKRQWRPDADLQRLAAELDRADPWRGYRYIPGEVRGLWDELRSRVGASGMGEHLRLLLLHFIEQFEPRFDSARLPKAFRQQFQGVFERIARQCAAGDLEASPDSDLFLKDLGIVRVRLIPCVSHLLYPWSGIPRRVILGQRIATLPRILIHVARMGGVRPLVENHVHPSMLDRFDAEGREACYGLIGDLLRVRPGLRGLMGASWYYDPNVARFSPKLSYLHDIPAHNGAMMLPLAPEGPDSGALARSSHRRALYEAGTYQPYTYLMMWSRQELLRYLDR